MAAKRGEMARRGRRAPSLWRTVWAEELNQMLQGIERLVDLAGVRSSALQGADNAQIAAA